MTNPTPTDDLELTEAKVKSIRAYVVQGRLATKLRRCAKAEGISTNQYFKEALVERIQRTERGINR